MVSSDGPAATTPEQPEGLGSPATPQPQLFIVLECDRPLAGGARFSLANLDHVSIGRGTDPDRVARREGTRLELRLPSSLLSSDHLRLAREGNRWTLEDPGSRNGTLVNRSRVTRHVLQDGDLLELGRIVMRFRMLAADERLVAPRVMPVGFATLVPSLAVELRELARIAASPLPVLLLGETGTGKELVARGIHELSGRAGPLVPVNCGALSGTLLDSQLFGHVRGSFTGAVRDEPGFVRSSDGGTLFLDEIGDLPMAAQAALLRVLQEREVVPVGSTRAIKVDLRIVAATHRQLDLLAARGEFRSDLYARLSGHIYYLTPLRDRREDIGVIVADLLRRIAPDGGAQLRFTAEAGRELVTHDWPLNIRQLEQSLARAITLAEDGQIQARHLVAPARPAAQPAPAERVDDSVRREALVALLVQHAGNISEVARVLDCSRTQVHRWLQRYKLDIAMYRR